MVELRTYEDGKDKVDASAELARRTLEYIEKHPDVSYSDASNAVLQADSELARAYANDDDSRTYDAEVKENNFIPAKPKKMTEHQASMQASAEIAKKAEIKMLELDCDYVRAQSLVFKEHPELLKAYCLEITDE